VTRIGKRFLFVTLLLTAMSTWAAVTVNSTVDRNEMGMGDTLTVTVSVSSTESVDVQDPRIPNIAGFDLVNTWTSSSTSSKLMRGAGGMQFETVRRQDFNYMVTPQKNGNLSLPAFEVVVDGKTYTTKPIVIKVSAQGSGAASRPQARANPGGFPDDEMDEEEALFNQLLQRRAAPEPSLKGLPKNQNEVLSVQLELDKTEVYEGEQIVANWYIYTRGNLLSLDRLKFPDLKGFWKEIIEEVPALNFTQEVVNGIPYRKALLASHALFPIKAGIAIVDEYKIKGSVQIPTNPFGNFGFGHAYTFNRASQRVKITVKPLPVEGKPQDFSGAVGQFEVRSSIEGNQFPVNQPFSLKVRFEGTGNAKLIELPPLGLPAGIEVYDTKSESKYFKNGRSYKEFEVLIIPRQEGALKIPAMSFSMFDPQSKKYVSKSTEAIEINIVAGSGAATNVFGATKSNTSDKPEKIAAKGPVLPNVLVSWNSSSSSKALAVNWVLGLLYAFIGAGLFFKARREFDDGQKKKDIKIEMQKRMKKVRLALENSDWRLVGTEMSNVIYYVLGELSGQGGASLEISKLLDQAPPSLRRDFGADFSKKIEIFQILSFAPESVVGNLKEKSVMKANMEEAEKLMIKALSAFEEAKD
jgi:hypothetical protein